MGLQIREARERIGISQKDLAKQLGIKPSTFNGYETGAHDPKSDLLLIIARALNTTTDFLLGLTLDPYPPTQDKRWSYPLVDAYASKSIETQKNICKILDLPHIQPPPQ